MNTTITTERARESIRDLRELELVLSESLKQINLNSIIEHIGVDESSIHFAGFQDIITKFKENTDKVLKNAIDAIHANNNQICNSILKALDTSKGKKVDNPIDGELNVDDESKQANEEEIETIDDSIPFSYHDEIKTSVFIVSAEMINESNLETYLLCNKTPIDEVKYLSPLVSYYGNNELEIKCAIARQLAESPITSTETLMKFCKSSNTFVNDSETERVQVQVVLVTYHQHISIITEKFLMKKNKIRVDNK